MFSVAELRLIRHSVSQTMEASIEAKKNMDPESDESIEAINDLMAYKILLEKIAEREDV